MGVATGCGCKEVYRFPHTIYLSLLLLYMFFFIAASLLFVHLKNFFSFFRPDKLDLLFLISHFLNLGAGGRLLFITSLFKWP